MAPFLFKAADIAIDLEAPRALDKFLKDLLFIPASQAENEHCIYASLYNKIRPEIMESRFQITSYVNTFI